MACSRSLLCARAPAGESAGKGAFERRADGLGAACRGEGPLAGRGVVARVQGDLRCGALGPGVRHRQLHRGGARLCRRCGLSCAVGVVERKPAAGEELEGVGAEALGGERYVRPAGGALEQLDRASVVAELVLGVGERERGPAADVAGLAVAGEVDGFLRGCHRGVEVAGGEGDVGAGVEAPGDGVGVAGQPRGLDRAVERLDRLAEAALEEPHHAEDRVDEREELALPGRAADRECTLGVDAGIEVTVQVELRAGEMAGGVEAPAELGVRERIDERRGFCAIDSGLFGRARKGGCARGGGDARRAKRRIVEPPRRGRGILTPSEHRAVVHAVLTVHRQLDHQGHALGGRAVRKVLERAQEPLMGLLVNAQEMFDPGGCGSELHPE